MQNAELMPKREVLKLECGSGFKGRRSGGGQHVKRVERLEERSTKGSQNSMFSFSSIFTIGTIALND
jgi:hypothetical protein